MPSQSMAATRETPRTLAQSWVTLLLTASKGSHCLTRIKLPKRLTIKWTMLSSSVSVILNSSASAELIKQRTRTTKPCKDRAACLTLAPYQWGIQAWSTMEPLWRPLAWTSSTLCHASTTWQSSSLTSATADSLMNVATKLLTPISNTLDLNTTQLKGLNGEETNFTEWLINHIGKR